MYEKILSISAVIGLIPLVGVDPSIAEKINLSLSLHDTRGAHVLLENLKDESSSDDPDFRRLLFEYFVETRDVESMKALWEKSPTPDSLDSATAEHIAWVNIETSSRSYHPKLRAEALLAAAGSQDIRGVHVLTRMLDDEHQGIQQMAVELASHYPDEPIQLRAKEMALKSAPEARIAAAELLAFQKAPSARDVLHAMLLDDTLSAEDHVIIASLLAQLSERVDPDWIRDASSDPKPSIRTLAATLVRTHPSQEGLRFLLPLLTDSSMAVRRCVFETFGLWQSMIPLAHEQLVAAWRQGLLSPSSAIAATSAWGLLLSPDEKDRLEANDWFEKTILTGTKDQSLIACGRLIKCGTFGLPLAQKLLPKVTDPLPKLNLAAYLLLNRTAVPAAAEGLRTALPATLLGDENSGLFQWIGANSSPHHPGIPRLPESEDLLIRLQLAALRRYAGQPVSREEVEHMLSDRAWGICAATSLFVFQEFASSLNEVLTPLLSHETETVRIQAALLLTIISQSDTAATILAEQYSRASREGKEALIIGFGCLPLSKTKPYLVPLLFDSSPAIRTRASGALIASMYK